MPCCSNRTRSSSLQILRNMMIWSTSLRTISSFKEIKCFLLSSCWTEKQLEFCVASGFNNSCPSLCLSSSYFAPRGDSLLCLCPLVTGCQLEAGLLQPAAYLPFPHSIPCLISQERKMMAAITVGATQWTSVIYSSGFQHGFAQMFQRTTSCELTCCNVFPDL